MYMCTYVIINVCIYIYMLDYACILIIAYFYKTHDCSKKMDFSLHDSRSQVPWTFRFCINQTHRFCPKLL